MLILAIETSGKEGSVAILEDGSLRARKSVPPTQTARLLAPAMAEVLREVGAAPGQLQLIAVSIGPGSFTGLRVGLTTAKTLAYGVGCDLIGVDTLDVIAAQAPADESGSSELHVVIDAQRRELFHARFAQEPPSEQRPERHWRRSGATEVVAADVWLGQLTPQTLVTGPVLKRLSDRIPAGVSVAPAAAWDPGAETVGKLAYAAWLQGRRDDLWKLTPAYIRSSYAEEKPTIQDNPRH